MALKHYAIPLVGGGNSGFSSYFNLTGTIGVTSVTSQVFGVEGVKVGQIKTYVVSNYTNFLIKGSNNADMSDSVEVLSGLFGASGNTINFDSTYKYYTITVSPGSTQYSSYARFWLNFGTFVE